MFLVELELLDSHLDPFDVLVHAADTLALGNLEKDEALVAPTVRPRVLDLPVVVEAIGVLKHAMVALSLARVPPLEDGALLVDGLGIGAVIVVVATVALLSVADQDDSVVDVGTAASVGSDNTLLVELEGATTSIDSDGHRVSLQLLLHALDAVRLADPTVTLDLANNLVRLMSALRLLARVARGVGIVAVEHDTMVLLESPGSGHPAAAAAPEAIFAIEIGAKHLLVARAASERAINEVLLREAHWGSARRLGNVAFEGRVRGEGPAGAAATLVLDLVHISVSEVIDSDGVDDTNTIADAATADVFQLGETALELAQARHVLLELAVIHITELVHLERGSVGLASGCRLGVNAIDNRLVAVEDLGTSVELADAVVRLVVVAHERNEFRVVSETIEATTKGASCSGADDDGYCDVLSHV